MTLSIKLLHKEPKYLQECCKLLNDEWKRSETARLRGLESSSDLLPTNIILLEDGKLVGHLKLSPIPSIQDGCYIESVVIQRNLRGKGYGTQIMQKAEDYCKKTLNLKSVYLSTRGQEEFYEKLGYEECAPVSIYGCPTIDVFKDIKPPPGAKPNENIKHQTSKTNVNGNSKTYMMKKL